MRTPKQIIITMVGIVLLGLFVIAIVNRIPPIPWIKPGNPNQPMPIAQSTDAPYPPPVDNTPSFTVTPETTPTPVFTLPAGQTDLPTITPIASSTTAAANDEGDIFYIGFDDPQQTKIKKVKTDKQGKKKSDPEDVVGLIPGLTINYVIPSPDGKLLVVRFLEEGPSDELFDLQKGMISERVFPWDYSFFGWHADSKHLLVSDTQGLWLIDAMGKDDRLIVSTDIEANDIQGAASSPDGRQVIYSISLQGGMSEIWMVTADGRDSRKILEAQGDARNFAWSPDGSRIVFWDGGYYYIMNADGTGFKLLSKLSGRGVRNVNIPPLWSPDGHYLLTDTSYPEVGLSDYNKSSIYLINVETGETKPLFSDGSTGHLFPSWSPTGNKIAYLSMKDGQVDLWVADIDGSNRIQLTTDGEYKFFQFWRK